MHFFYCHYFGGSAIISLCRYGSSVECQLPKLKRRVRLPLSAFFDGEFPSELFIDIILQFELRQHRFPRSYTRYDSPQLRLREARIQIGISQQNFW